MNATMRLLMLTEYFYPHAHGGSEYSSYYLAKSLVERGHKLAVLTPNYGALAQQNWKGIAIFRFFIGPRITPPLTPFWHTNLFWFIQSLRYLYLTIKKFNPQVIHIQGKYFLPAAVIVGKLFRLPVIFTIRDYQILCPLGLCLWHKHRHCSLWEFIFSELPRYLNLYVPAASFFHRCLQVIAALRGRLISSGLRWFTRHVDAMVTTSLAQQQIFSANGFNSQVIYNTIDFPRASHVSRHKQIIFAGRLTPGKGARLLVPTLLKLKTPGYKLLIAGTGILQPKIKPHPSVRLLGHLDHDQLMQLYSESQLALVPSLWPENFGRSALEAIAAGTPVVTSTRGGLPEIVQRKYGLSVEPSPIKLAQAVDYVLKHRHSFASRIKRDRAKLIQQFNRQPVDQYEALYLRCLA